MEAQSTCVPALHVVHPPQWRVHRCLRLLGLPGTCRRPRRNQRGNRPALRKHRLRHPLLTTSRARSPALALTEHTDSTNDILCSQLTAGQNVRAVSDFAERTSETWPQYRSLGHAKRRVGGVISSTRLIISDRSIKLIAHICQVASDRARIDLEILGRRPVGRPFSGPQVTVDRHHPLQRRPRRMITHRQCRSWPASSPSSRNRS